MTIAIFKEYAFLITNLEKATNTYACAHCDARFTKSCNLLRHAERCSNGQTKIKCPGEKIFAPRILVRTHVLSERKVWYKSLLLVRI